MDYIFYKKETMPVNYANGKIYAIRSYQTDQIYVGSTTQPLHVRMAGHRASFRCWKNGKGNYVSSYEILEYNDAYIELVCEFKCENKMQLLKKEGEVIRATENCINKCIAGRDMKTYRQQNKETIAAKKKTYRRDHEQKIKQYEQERKQYRSEKITCECGIAISRRNISTHRKSTKHQRLLELDMLIQPLI